MWWTAVFEAFWTVSLLPNGATRWERALEAVDAGLVARNPVELIAASRSDALCPLPLLPYLAAERSVDEFSGAWAETRQRAVVAASFALHQRKGTRAALDRALVPLGFSLKTIEWFEREYLQRPNTFRLLVDIDIQQSWTKADRARVIRAANGAKNAHTLLEAIETRREAAPATTYVGGIIRRFRTIHVDQFPRPETVRATDAFAFTAAVATRRRTLRIQPRLN